MSQTVLNYIFVGLSFALYFGIAIWARAASTSEFYAAGRGVHPVMNGMATAADWMSAASFLSMAGLLAFGGYQSSWFLMGWTGGYVLLALLLAPYLRKFGKFTVPEFVGDRYYSKTARVIAVTCLIIASVTYVIGQMKGVGVAFSRFFEVQVSTGIWIGTAVVAVYAILGGMKGITYTQVAQYCVLIIAYTIPAIFISLNLTGNFFPQIGVFGTDVQTGQPLLETLDLLVKDLGFNYYTAYTNNWLNMTLYTLTLMIGTAGLPHVIMRFFTVPKVSDARWSAGWALVFIALLYTTAPAVGAMARLNLTMTIYPNGTQADPIAVDAQPEWMINWEQTGLLKIDDKNGDGLINYNAYNADKDGNLPANAPEGAVANEMTVDNDIIVLANPEIAGLPGWVIAIVVAGGLAAALSTAAGLLMAISSAVSHDLIKGVFNPNISEKSELRWARLSMLGAVLLAAWLGLNPPGFAAQVVALAFGIAAASLFPTILMGIFSTRMNKEGAIAGMLAGLLITLFYIFQFKGWFFIGQPVWTADKQWLGISPEAFGAVGAGVNFLVAFIVSRFTAPPPKEIVDLVESIRLPGGASAAADH